MKKILPKIILVAVIVLLAAACVVVSCLFGGKVTAGAVENVDASVRKSVFARTEEELADEDVQNYVAASKHMKSVVSVDDLYLPETLVGLDLRQPFGLFIFDGEKNVPYGTEGVFDESKKTLIFAHGMGSNGPWDGCRLFYDNGYNVLNFLWGAFADESPGEFVSLSAKVWFHGAKRFHTADGKGWQWDEKLTLSVAEMYVAFYLDLLGKHPNYDSKEIVLAGHSYGGMLTTAVLSYLTTAFGNGLVDARVLPDRALLCDPYFVGGSSEGTVPWLNEMHPPERGGTIFFSKQAVINAHRAGISVTLLRSSNYIAMAFFLAYEWNEAIDAIDAFNAETFYVFGNALTMPKFDLSDAHNYGKYWPAQQIEPLYDAVRHEYAFSLFDPYHGDYARVHESYVLDYNKTPYVYDDDTFTYDTPEKSKLYGFVFLDKNGNGEPDDRIASHVVGATVVVKNAAGEEILRTVTGLNGYFEAIVPAGVYTVEVSLPKELSLVGELAPVTVEEGAYFTPCFVAVAK